MSDQPIGRAISVVVMGNTNRDYPIEDEIFDAAHTAGEKHGLDVTCGSGPYFYEGDETDRKLAEVTAERDHFKRAAITIEHEVEQTLGKALGYPVYGPDGPGAEGDVCVGDHVAESLAAEAAKRVGELTAERARLRAAHALLRIAVLDMADNDGAWLPGRTHWRDMARAALADDVKAMGDPEAYALEIEQWAMGASKVLEGHHERP